MISVYYLLIELPVCNLMSLPGVELVAKGESLNISSLILDFYCQLITTSVSYNTFVQPLANTIQTESYQFQNKTITISFPTSLSFSWNTYAVTKHFK